MGAGEHARRVSALSSVRRLLAGWRFALTLRVLPPRVAVFMLRARRHALRAGDAFSLDSAIRAEELATLIGLGRGRSMIVELGTGTGWSAIALALATPGARLISYDPVVRAERDRYLGLIATATRARIELRELPDTAGPLEGERPGLLFVDSAHYRDPVLAAFGAWREHLAPGAVVAFHDFDHPDYPGVREAIEQLGLKGWIAGGMFLWRAPA